MVIMIMRISVRTAIADVDDRLFPPSQPVKFNLNEKLDPKQAFNIDA